MSHQFKLAKVVFEANSWRKLSGLTIPIAPRLTVIAGHNGIGKSSILGFIANAAGLEKLETGETVKSYFGSPFVSQFQEQFRLTEADISTGDPTKGCICLHFEVDNGNETIEKVCNIGKTSTSKGAIRFRVVPRTRGGKTLFGVGPDQKVQTPTLFISASRVWPVGEASDVKVLSQKDMDSQDADFIKRIHNRLVPLQAKSGAINQLNLSIGNNALKRASYPTYDYDVTAISLGQGSVGSIATALASFKKLKRDLGKEYKGGILVIDEIEAGLHPRAQEQLVEVLCSTAKELKLQVIVTTHSLVILEAIAQKMGNPSQAIDKIIYLIDTQSPRMLEVTDLQLMRDEMTLSKTASARARRPVVYIYTEDEEALFLLNCLEAEFSDQFLEDQKVILRKVPLSIGAGQLHKLVSNTKCIHFRKESVCIFDGDKKGTPTPEGTVCLFLPTAGGRKNSPEKEIERFLENAKKNINFAKELQDRGVSSDFCNACLDELKAEKGVRAKMKPREANKKWFSKLPKAKKKAIVKAWARCYEKEFRAFIKEYRQAIKTVRQKVLYCPHYQEES